MPFNLITLHSRLPSYSIISKMLLSVVALLNIFHNPQFPKCYNSINKMQPYSHRRSFPIIQRYMEFVVTVLSITSMGNIGLI